MWVNALLNHTHHLHWQLAYKFWLLLGDAKQTCTWVVYVRCGWQRKKSTDGIWETPNCLVCITCSFSFLPQNMFALRKPTNFGRVNTKLASFPGLLPPPYISPFLLVRWGLYIRAVYALHFIFTYHCLCRPRANCYELPETGRPRRSSHSPGLRPLLATRECRYPRTCAEVGGSYGAGRRGRRPGWVSRGGGRRGSCPPDTAGRHSLTGSLWLLPSLAVSPWPVEICRGHAQ